MKITKYEHACVVIEDQGKRLVIDPGSWTEDFGQKLCDQIGATYYSLKPGESIEV